jgi:hypothetical protein
MICLTSPASMLIPCQKNVMKDLAKLSRPCPHHIRHAVMMHPNYVNVHKPSSPLGHCYLIMDVYPWPACPLPVIQHCSTRSGIISLGRLCSDVPDAFSAFTIVGMLCTVKRKETLFPHHQTGMISSNTCVLPAAKTPVPHVGGGVINTVVKFQMS